MIDIPISDQDYKDGLEYLRRQCGAFQRFEREMIQFIGDNLASANLLIGASIKYEALVCQEVPTKRLVLLKSINDSILKRLRGE